MDTTKALTVRYNELNAQLSPEADKLINDLLDTLEKSDSLIYELINALDEEKQKREEASKAYDRLEDAYSRLLSRL